MKIRTGLFVAAIAVASPSGGIPALAQSGGHAGHGHEISAHAAQDSATAAYREAMDRMHEAMGSLDYSDDADLDFARGMIPHHQAAIDMARIVIEHGEDPEIRRLAEEIMEAQEQEILQLEEWIARHAR